MGYKYPRVKSTSDRGLKSQDPNGVISGRKKMRQRRKQQKNYKKNKGEQWRFFIKFLIIASLCYLLIKFIF